MDNEKNSLFTDICKRNKLKVTPQRMAVFRELSESKEHPSAEDIYQSLQKDFPRLSFDTIYRTLSTFTEIGITEVIEGYGRSKRFDPNLKQHHHLHCTRCGDIFDFYSDAYDNLEIPEQVYTKFKVQSTRVVLKGICGKCKDS
jgi:Fur family peroxide stress response transcriptional regulator